MPATATRMEKRVSLRPQPLMVRKTTAPPLPLVTGLPKGKDALAKSGHDGAVVNRGRTARAAAVVSSVTPADETAREATDR
jgi:hypothetical protein